MPIDRKVNLKENPILYFDVEGAARFNITVGYQLVENDVVTNADKYVQIGALYKGSTNNYIPAGTKSTYNLYDYLKNRCFSDGSITINYVIFSLAGDKDQTAKFKSCYLAPETSGDWPAVPALSIDAADAPVNMMPASAADITHGNANGDGSYTYENGVLKLVSASGRDSLSWPVNKWVDINELKELNAKIKSENGGFTGLLYTCASDPKDASGMMHYVNDFTGDFGVTAANGYIPAGDYDAMLDIDALLTAKNWNCAKDTNNVIYIKSALLVAEPGATVTMSGLVFPANVTLVENSLLPVDGLTTAVPYSADGVTGEATVSFDENGVATITQPIEAWMAWPTMKTTYPEPIKVNLKENPILTFDIGGTAGEANFYFDYVDASGAHTFTASSFIGKDSGYNLERAKGELSGSYDVGGYLAGKDGRLPEDGIITITEVRYQIIGVKDSTTVWNDLTFGPKSEPTTPSETEPSETEPTDVPGPSTGAAATPDQPYHAWAADSKPANVTVGTNLLDSAKGDSSDKVTFNADGSLSYSWNGWATYSLKGFTVNLEENPYLYWSIEQGNAGSSGTFALYASAPWLTSRSKALTADGTLFTGDGNGVPGADYITGNETGCFNMYEWYKAVNAEGLSAKAISELKFYGTGTADITINYMFFGPAPSTEPSVTEPSETEPSVTEPSETEPSETEPSETEPSETEPSETKPTTPVETKTSIISFNPEDWTTDVPENMEIVKGADGSLEIANTNGAWPAAGYVLPNGGITFDPAKTTLNYDFTVGPSTNIILFFNGSTPDEYKDGQHKTITHKIDGAELNGDDITGNGASFKGSFSLNDPDYFPSACYNEDGTMTLTGVRIFAAGAAGSKVVVRELSIETEGAPTEPTDTQPTDTEPTETEPTDTQPTDTQPTETEPTGTDSSVNTTASSATTATTASTQKDNPKTGDDLTMISLGLALIAVSAGALFFFRRKQA